MNDMLLTSKSVTDRPLELAENRGALFVTFKIAYQYCALRLAETLEVVRLPALVELAGAPPILCGLLNLRGRYIPVLDARALMGAPATYDLNSQIVIAGRGKPEYFANGGDDVDAAYGSVSRTSRPRRRRPGRLRYRIASGCRRTAGCRPTRAPPGRSW